MIAERTADTHVQHILNKLGFSARTQVAAWAAEQGLAPPARAEPAAHLAAAAPVARRRRLRLRTLRRRARAGRPAPERYAPAIRPLPDGAPGASA